MKKFFIAMTILTMLAMFNFAYSEGIVIINGENNVITLDDVQIGNVYELDELGELSVVSFDYRPWIGQYATGSDRPSGKGAVGIGAADGGQLAVFKCNIVNTTYSDIDYLKNASVKVVFDGEYEIQGWCGQINYNNQSQKHSDFGWASGIQNKEYYISKEDQFCIKPFYEGHYCFIVDIPNRIIDSEASLEMVINLGEQELIYIIH